MTAGVGTAGAGAVAAGITGLGIAPVLLHDLQGGSSRYCEGNGVGTPASAAENGRRLRALASRMVQGDRRPLDHEDAGENGGKDGKRHVERWGEANRGRERVVNLLRPLSIRRVRRYIRMMRNKATGEYEPKKYVEVGAICFPGGRTLLVDGRGTPEDWIADPQRAVEAMSACDSFGVVGGVVNPKTGRIDEPERVPCGCGHRICQQCQRIKSKVRSDKYTPSFAALGAAGCPLLSLALTQPQVEYDVPRPVILTDDERARMKLPEGFTVVRRGEGYAVPHESLPDAWGRHHRALQAVRKDARSRDWWERTVFAYVKGIEATGSNVRGGLTYLRWHAHSHILVALYPDVDADEWWTTLLRVWCGEQGVVARRHDLGTAAVPEAQHMARLPSGEPDAVREAVAEVVKYPHKLDAGEGGLTAAQLCEVLACSKGLRAHHAGGALHATDARGAAVRALVEANRATWSEAGELRDAGALADVAERDRTVVCALAVAKLDATYNGKRGVLYIEKPEKEPVRVHPHSQIPYPRERNVHLPVVQDKAGVWWRPLTDVTVCRAYLDGDRPLQVRVRCEGELHPAHVEHPSRLLVWMSRWRGDHVDSTVENGPGDVVQGSSTMYDTRSTIPP